MGKGDMQAWVEDTCTKTRERKKKKGKLEVESGGSRRACWLVTVDASVKSRWTRAQTGWLLGKKGTLTNLIVRRT